MENKAHFVPLICPCKVQYNVLGSIMKYKLKHKIAQRTLLSISVLFLKKLFSHLLGSLVAIAKCTHHQSSTMHEVGKKCTLLLVIRMTISLIKPTTWIQNSIILPKYVKLWFKSPMFSDSIISCGIIYSNHQ